MQEFLLFLRFLSENSDNDLFLDIVVTLSFILLLTVF